MRRKVVPDAGRRPDERVTTMLERHVRDRHDAAAIRTRADAPLQKRLTVAR